MSGPWREALGVGVEALLRGGRPALARWAQPGYFDPGLALDPTGTALLLSCAWLGDNLWASQVLPALRARYPRARFEVATRPAAVSLWTGADAVHPLAALPADRRREPCSWSALWAAAIPLRERFQLVIDLTGNRYSALFSFLTRPQRTLGFGGDELGGLYSTRLELDREVAHLARRPWRLVAPLLGEERRPSPAVVPPPAPPYAEQVRALGLDPTRPLAVLAPGAGWPSKRWPEDRFRALAERLAALGLQLAGVGAPGEAGLLQATVGGLGATLTGTLEQTLALMSGASLVVANDSVPAHLGAAYGRPVVALYGPTHPERCGPLGPRVVVLRHRCPWRPETPQHHCHDQPGYACPSSCWDGLCLEEVLAACRRALAIGDCPEVRQSEREREGGDPSSRAAPDRATRHTHQSPTTTQEKEREREE